MKTKNTSATIHKNDETNRVIQNFADKWASMVVEQLQHLEPQEIELLRDEMRERQAVNS